MYVSTLIDLMIYIFVILFGFHKLLDWFYEGPHASAIFVSFAVIVVLVTLWLFYGRKSSDE